MNKLDKKLEEMTVEILPTDFIYPEIKETDFIVGSDNIDAPILRSDGDWRPYTPPEEEQRRNGVESSACFVEGCQHSLASIQEEEYDLIDQNYSARFNLMFSSASPQGGDPLKAAQSFRDKGLIPDEMLPFSEEITSWEEFNSFKGGDKAACLKQGKKWREIWDPKYSIAVKREYDVVEKYRILRQVLKSCPAPVSVYAWVIKDGLYIKPKGVRDNHLAELVYIDSDNHPYIWDTYPPFLKKLEPFYDFDFGMRWTLTRVDKKKDNWLVDLIKRLLLLK